MRFNKALVAAVISVLILLVSDLDSRLVDGVLDTRDWFALALLVLNAVGVYFTPNRSADLVVRNNESVVG